MRQEATIQLANQLASPDEIAKLVKWRQQYKNEIDNEFVRHGVEVLATYTSPITAWPSEQTWPTEIKHDDEIMSSTLHRTP